MKRLLLALCFFLGLQHAALAASCSSYPFTLQNNTTADATQVMANFNTVRNCVINNAAGSGVNTDITSITGLSTPLSVPQGGTPVFIGGTSGGTANAQTVASTNPIGFSLTNGYRITFIAGSTNTGAMASPSGGLNVNSTGLTTVKKVGHAGLEALVGGEIVTGNVVEAIYDGTQFVLLSTDLGGVGAATSITAASTTDLGTISTHNALINGTTSITSFGSTAAATDPIYLIRFSGALTLTYNATSLLIPGSGNITTAANDTAVVEYLGTGNWQVLSYTKYSGAGIVPTTPLCGAQGFTASTSSDTAYAMAATTAVLVDTASVTKTVSAVSLSINATINGANGLDTGSLGVSHWYYGWIINNGSTTAGLLSLSATAPTMPGGYTFKCLLGYVPTDGSSKLMRMDQTGNEVFYTITSSGNTTFPPIVSNGTVGTFSLTTPTLAAKTVTGDGFCAPTGATGLWVTVYSQWKGGTGAAILVAPTTGWGYTNSGPQGSAGVVWPIYTQVSTSGYMGYLHLSGSTIGVASDNTGGVVACPGFKMNSNAS